MLGIEIRRDFDDKFQVYGVRKVWRQLMREGHDVARCTVARLMKKMALQGVILGGRVRTTVSELEPIGHVPPAEAEAAYYAALEEPARLAA